MKKKPSLKKQFENLQKAYKELQEKTRAYVLEVNSMSNRRRVMTVEPANANGSINGMTIPELVLLVNLSETTGETVVLETENNKHNLVVIAKKRTPRVPLELL